MKTIFFVLFLFPFFLFGQSPKKMFEMAEQLYESERYREAASYYGQISQLAPKQLKFKYRWALSLYRGLQYEEAMEIFAELTSTSNEYTSAALYYYGVLLKIDTKYQEADSVFEQFLIREPNDQTEFVHLVLLAKEGAQLAMKQSLEQRTYLLDKLPQINSKAHDFGGDIDPVTGQLVISTSRNMQTGQFGDDQYGGYLPDLVTFNPVGETWQKESEKVWTVVNTAWAEGGGSFSSDSTSYYYTSCLPTNESQCQIYVTIRSDSGSWQAPRLLPKEINYPGSKTEHPFISQSGDTLYFASNRPNGKGGMDIWMSLKGAEDSWTPAINLGEVINTPQNEVSPYYSSAFDCLLFSSNGQVGYGGYDTYLAKGVSFFEPNIYNIGTPFNSSYDDCFFRIQGKVGFFSTNRMDDHDFDIWSFLFPNERKFLENLISEDALTDARILNSKYRQLRFLDLQTFRAEDYLGYSLFRAIRPARPSYFLQAGSQFNIVGKVRDSNSAVRLVLSDVLEIITLSDDNGHFVYQMIGDSLIGDEKIYDFSDINPAITHQKQDTSATFFTHEIENLYFDFGSSVLRPESKMVLNDLIQAIGTSKENIIEIRTHADLRGDHDYNVLLSERRGISIMNHLKALGCSPSSMRVIAEGESSPISSQHTWYGHLFNRRAGITVYSSTTDELEKSHIYVVRKSLSLERAAQYVGVTVEVLQKLNNHKNSFEKGDILRVPFGSYSAPNIQYLLDEVDIKNNVAPYRVKQGDDLTTIALKFSMPEELIREMNHLTEAVYPGQEILIFQ